MSLPIAIRSTTSSRASSIAELLHFPPSPPFVSERHACAYPSWPDRASLGCTSAPTERSTSCYFSDLDLSAPKQYPIRPAYRLAKPANYLELEFEDDSDDEDMPDSASNGTPEAVELKPSSSKSLLGEQLRREKFLKEKRLRFTTAR